MQGVEPTAGLTGIFHNEISGRMRIKPLFVLKGVVLLRKRHGARLKPAVQHLWNTAHHGLAGGIVWVGANQLVDIGPVQ